MKYSQNLEEQIIAEYFCDYTGTLLDIGANDGKTFSNSLALIERGWSGILIEPAGTPFDKLVKLHSKRKNIFCLNIAIGNINGLIDMFSMGSHIGDNDTDLLTTTIADEMKRWGNVSFVRQKIICFTFKKFLADFPPNPHYDFITIDAEGADYDILTQIDLKATCTRLICVEHNGKEIEKYTSYCANFGMKAIHLNNENIMMAL